MRHQALVIASVIVACGAAVGGDAVAIFAEPA